MCAENHELETAIRTIFEAESRLSQARPWIEDCRNELRPPADPEAVRNCERFLSRRFSPSYRRFLSLHDGWLGCFNGCRLLGTADYLCDAVARESIAVTLYTQLLYALDMNQQSLVPDVRSGLYAPERFYRFIDAPPRPGSWPELKSTVEGYEARHGRMLHAAHTIIGLGPESIVVLDRNSLRANGEMDAVLWNEGSEERWPTFAAMLNDIARAYSEERMPFGEVARHGAGTI